VVAFYGINRAFFQFFFIKPQKKSEFWRVVVVQSSKQMVLALLRYLERHSQNLSNPTAISLWRDSVLFIIGAILLYFADEKKGQSEIEFLRLNKGKSG